MKRRAFFGKAGLAAGTLLTSGAAYAETEGKKASLKVAHITDVHIRPEENVPQRAIAWLEKV